MSNKEIDFIECRFVMHRKESKDKLTGEAIPDTHYVREKVTYKDGSTENRLRIVENYERDIWITRPEFRTHKLKKESEELEKVFSVKATESNKWDVASRLLKVKGYDPTLVKDSPYLYGADVKTGVFIKRDYNIKYPDKFTKYDVACLDIENDVDTNEITIITIVKEGVIHTCILKSLVAKYTDVTNTILKTAKQHMPDGDKFKIEIKYFDTELELVLETMKKVHEWEPDLLSVWNLDYDLSMILNVLEKNGVRPEDVLCDPDLPKEHRFFKYKRAMDYKVSSSGVKKGSDIQDKWNTFICPAKFYWVDGMVVYNYIRVNTKKVPTGYGLDSILDHEMGDKFKKLKFAHLNDGDYIKVDWHRFMSHKHPIEYIVYNMWDAMSMIYLDNHTRDLIETFPILSDISMFEDFSYGPIRSLNAMLFFFLERGKVVGTKAKNLEARRTLGVKDFIVALPNKLYQSRVNSGILLDDIKKTTNVAQFVFDLDQVSAYPMDQITLNSGGDTTVLELISISGIDKDIIIPQNVNLFSGPVSSIGYCRIMFKSPSLFTLNKVARRYLGGKNEKITNSDSNNTNGG